MNRSVHHQPSRHVWEFIETLSGPFIYLIFFGLSYLASSLSCALWRTELFVTMSIGEATTGIAIGLAVVALMVLGTLVVKSARMLTIAKGDNEDRFLGMTTFMLAILSALAVVWTMLAAVFVTATC